MTKNFLKIAKIRILAETYSLNLTNLAENNPNFLYIGGKVAQNCSIFGKKIASTGHSEGEEPKY